MYFMSVTLEVSRLSGWLNADACCRASKEGHAVRGAVYGQGAAGGGRPRRTQRAGEGATAGWGQGTRAAHEEHPPHGSDLGRVEAQRLVESLRVLPSRREGTYDAGRPRWGGMVGRRRCKRHARGGPDTRSWRPGHARAHLKHAFHGCDAGRVEAQRLVERRRILPRVERRAYRAGRGAAWEAAEDRGASRVQEGLDCRLGAGHGEERT